MTERVVWRLLLVCVVLAASGAATGRALASCETGCTWTTRAASVLQQALAGAPRHGVTASFHADRLPVRLETRQITPELDRLLTDAALSYAHIMSAGQVDPASIERNFGVPRPQLRHTEELRAALASGEVGNWLARLPPQDAEYARLKRALETYRAIAAHGGWPALPAGPVLNPGAEDARVPLLRRRLTIEGDLQSDADGPAFDPVTVAALVRFQTRHGLAPDGRVGNATLAALNVPAGDRVDQIVANLERWRWFSRVIPATRVELNAAEAVVRLYRDNIPVLAMKAVVGAPRSPTPHLLATIEAVTINPAWHVPSSIARNEIVPLLRRDPGYLARNGFFWRGEGTSRQLVQAPGADNALGRIKLEMPNRFSVYLHDTPARALFQQYERARSHGCVRLELPRELAEELLGADWPHDRIEQAVAAGTTQRVTLPEPVPVFLAYWTAFVDEDSTVNFRKDIYGRDRRVIEALQQRDPTPLVASIPAPTGCQA